VIWSYVTATPSENAVTIKWGTLQEENTSHFIVERNEGNGYTEIANVQAAGNSTLPLHYSFVDATVASENVSYRIRQVDIDGKSSYSQVVHVRRNAARQLFSVFPNPATNQVTVKFDGNNSADLRIIDSKGTILQRLKVSNNQTIDLGRLPAGVYHFVMSDGRSKRVVKL
jgi:hypothetical protein